MNRTNTSHKRCKIFLQKPSIYEQKLQSAFEIYAQFIEKENLVQKLIASKIIASKILKQNIFDLVSSSFWTARPQTSRVFDTEASFSVPGDNKIRIKLKIPIQHFYTEMSNYHTFL